MSRTYGSHDKIRCDSCCRTIGPPSGGWEFTVTHADRYNPSENCAAEFYACSRDCADSLAYKLTYSSAPSAIFMFQEPADAADVVETIACEACGSAIERRDGQRWSMRTAYDTTGAAIGSKYETLYRVCGDSCADAARCEAEGTGMYRVVEYSAVDR